MKVTMNQKAKIKNKIYKIHGEIKEIVEFIAESKEEIQISSEMQHKQQDIKGRIDSTE